MKLLTQKRSPIWLFILSLLTQPLYLNWYSCGENENFLPIFTRYYTSLALIVITFFSLIWLIFLLKNKLIQIASFILVTVLGYSLYIWYQVSFMMLPYKTEQLVVSPNKQHTAITYNVGFIEIHPKLVIESKNTSPKIVYEGPENSILDYKWLNNETLEMRITPLGSVKPIPYDKPFKISIKDNYSCRNQHK